MISQIYSIVPKVLRNNPCYSSLSTLTRLVALEIYLRVILLLPNRSGNCQINSLKNLSAILMIAGRCCESQICHLGYQAILLTVCHVSLSRARAHDGGSSYGDTVGCEAARNAPLTHPSKETMLEQHPIPAIITNVRIRPLSARAKAKSNPEHTRHSMHKRFSVRICCNTFRRSKPCLMSP